MPQNPFQKNILKLPLIILTVLLLTWGITKATENELQSARDKFNVIGTVSDISTESLSLINARGTNDNTEELYNLNITYLDKVETSTYDPLVQSDIKVGDTLIAQGVTNGSTFFIQRIVLFPQTPLEPQDLTATSTDSIIATTTEDIATTTQEETTQDTTGSSDEEQTEDTPLATTTEDVASTTEEATTTDLLIATTTDPVIATTTPEEATSTATTTESIIETITDVVEEVLDTATEVLDVIVDTITQEEEIYQEEVPPREPVPLESQQT